MKLNKPAIESLAREDRTHNVSISAQGLEQCFNSTNIGFYELHYIAIVIYFLITNKLSEYFGGTGEGGSGANQAAVKLDTLLEFKNGVLRV